MPHLTKAPTKQEIMRMLQVSFDKSLPGSANHGEVAAFYVGFCRALSFADGLHVPDNSSWSETGSYDSWHSETTELKTSDGGDTVSSAAWKVLPFVVRALENRNGRDIDSLTYDVENNKGGGAFRCIDFVDIQEMDDDLKEEYEAIKSM